MPFKSVDPEVIALRVPFGNDGEERPAEPTIDLRRPPSNDDPSVVGAAFRSQNIVGSLIARMSSAGHEPELNHNPLDVIKGTYYESDYLDDFVGSRSTAETKAIMARIDREQADRRKLANSGVMGLVAQIGMGAADPTIAIPGGALVKAGRGGFSALKTMAKMGAMGAVGVGVQESILQGTQLTRSPDESFINIGSATLLAGLLGAGAAKFLSAAERQAAIKSLDALRKDVNQRPTGGSSGLPQSGGSAAADTRTLEPVSMVPESVKRGAQALRSAVERVPGGRVVANVLSAPAKLITHSGPLTRTFYESGSTMARRAMADLAEIPFRVKENLLGLPTSFGGQSVETAARLAVLGGRYKLALELDRLFSEYYFGKPTMLGKMRSGWEQARGTAPEKMSWAKFKDQVDEALRDGDVHAEPTIRKAAEFIRREIIEPWKEAAITAKLLPEGVSVDTSASYFMRVYNKQKIEARKPEFWRRVTQYLKADQETKAQLQAEIQSNRDETAKLLGNLRKLDKRLDRNLARQEDIASRFSERSMASEAAQKRVSALAQRQSLAEEDVADLEEFMGDLKELIQDPEIKAEIDDLLAQARELKKQDKPMTEADLDKIEAEERKGILVGPMRQAARIAAGKRKPFKVPSFLAWMKNNGGIKDTGGDIKAILGTLRAFPALVKKNGLSLDQWGEKLTQEFPDRFINRPSPREVAEFIDEASRGNTPDWFAERMVNPEELQANQLASVIEEMANRRGVNLESTDDVAELLRNPDVERTLDDMLAEEAQGGGGIPVRGQIEGLEEAVSLKRAEIQQVKDMAAEVSKSRQAALRKLEGEGIRGREAQVALNAQTGRLGVLDRRAAREEIKQELLERAREGVQRQLDELQVRVEETLGKWQGKSADEVKAALKARADAESNRQLKIEAGIYEGKGARFTSADRAVNRAVKKIMRSERNKSDQELMELAKEITNRIISSPDGRLPYDAPTGGPRTGFAGANGPTIPPRAALAARDFHIPDKLIRDFLVTDVEQVAHNFLGTIVPDVLITSRFGDVDMTKAFRELDEEFDAKIAAASSEKEIKRLGDQRNVAIRDLAAVRDRLRGSYGWSGDSIMQNAARVTGALGSFNVLADMGGSAINQLTDFAGPIFRHGMLTVFRDGWSPMINLLMNTDKGKVTKELARQYRAMGIATDVRFNTRSLDEVGEQYHPKTRFERGLRGLSQGYMVANLSAPMTDTAKMIASIVSGSEILNAVKASAAGKATRKQIANLGESNIPPEMAERIWRAFQQGGETREGVMLPNTADWTDLGAREAFEGAVSREANIAVVTPGQEKALWMSNPILRILGQFKSFTGSATTRILLANLQRRDAATLQGLVASMALGAMGYKAYNTARGEPTSERPQDWVKEAMSRSGMLGWLDETNTLASKFTRGQMDMYRLMGADRPLSRYASRGFLGQLLGPTAGKIENAAQAAGALANDEFSAADTSAVRKLMPLQNLFYIRVLLNEVEKGFNSAVGIPAKRERREAQ